MRNEITRFRQLSGEEDSNSVSNSSQPKKAKKPRTEADDDAENGESEPEADDDEPDADDL